jgi:hypothetical protein
LGVDIVKTATLFGVLVFFAYSAVQADNISSSKEYRMSDKEYSRNQKHRQTEDQREDAMATKENLEHTLKKALAAKKFAEEVLAEAKNKIEQYDLQRVQAEEKKSAEELDMQKTLAELSAEVEALQKAQVWIQQHGGCVPSTYSAGGCYEMIINRGHNFPLGSYFHGVGCDEDILMAHCRGYFAMSKPQLEGIRARGCVEGGARRWDGCDYMARYAIDARNAEERYSNCVRDKDKINNEVIPVKKARISVLTLAKQGALATIENAIKDIEKAAADINKTKWDKENANITVLEQEEIIKNINIELDAANQKIELANSALEKLNSAKTV